MKSQIEEAALRILISGESINKFILCLQVRCTEISAQRKLSSMHRAGVMRISSWVKNGVRNIPVYKMDGKKDIPKPPQLTPAERCKRRYKKDAVKYLVKQRISRMNKKLNEGKISYATNPYGLLYRIADQRGNRVCD